MLTSHKVPRQPLFLAALAYAAGIITADALWRPPVWWLAALALACGGASIFVYTRRFGGRLALVMGLAGLFASGAFSLAGYEAGAHASPDLARFLVNDETMVTGHVMHDGVLRGGGPHKRQSVDIETEELTLDEVATRLATGIRITVYRPDEQRGDDNSERADDNSEGALPPVHTYGQRLRFPVKLRAPRNFQNPGEWDYRGYLAQQGIYATGSVRDDRMEPLPGFAGSGYALWASRARRSVLAHIHALWRPGEAGLLDAALIGERSFIDRDTSVNWQRTGTYHVLVVSGMNLGILAGVIFWTLLRLRASQTLATVVTILVAFGYAYLAESGSPVVRSALMVALYLCTRLLYRDRAALNVIGGAALGILVFDPRAVFEASFQLTFMAVVIIAGVGVPLLERTSGGLRQALDNLDLPAYDLSLTPRLVQFRLDLRLLSAALARLLPRWPVRIWQRPGSGAGVPDEPGVGSAGWKEEEALRARVASWSLTRVLGFALRAFDLLVISVLMQIALVALMAYYFHRATVVGIAANALAVPLTGILMPSAAAAVALSYLWLPLAKIPALIASLSLQGITGTVKMLGTMQIADVRVASPAFIPMVAAAAAIAIAIVLARRRALLSALGVAAMAATSLWIALVPPPLQVRPGVLEMTAIDVGQADSTLLVTPEGRTLLVDAAGSLGPFQSEFDFGEQVVSPYLWARGFSRLDAVALTHAHSDHYGGMRAVIANFRPRELWLGPIPETPPIKALIATAQAYNVRIVRRVGGDKFAFGGAEVEVLAPPADWPVSPQPRNNDSMVLRLSYGATAAIVEADAEKQEEVYMLDNDNRPGTVALSADVLRVAHNGSRTSSIPEFLAAVHPTIALISVGAHNSFGHPRREVLQRLGEMHVRTYRTDTMGGITSYLDGSKVEAMPVPR